MDLSAKPAFEHTTDPNVHTERQWEIGEWLEGAAGRGIQVDGWCAIDDEELVSLSEEKRYESRTGEARRMKFQNHQSPPSTWHLKSSI